MDRKKDRCINAGFLSHNDFATTYLCQVDMYISIYKYTSIPLLGRRFNQINKNIYI